MFVCFLRVQILKLLWQQSGQHQNYNALQLKFFCKELIICMLEHDLVVQLTKMNTYLLDQKNLLAA